jgi:hypothetical protein
MKVLPLLSTLLILMSPLKALLFVGFLTLSAQAWAQTCTLSGTGTISWVNASPPACQEGGNAGSASIIIIPSGVNLAFDDNVDTWTGTRMEVRGTLTISAPGQVQINANLLVTNNASIQIQSKLDIGGAEPCNYNLILESGSVVNITGSTPERLAICGDEIARGGTAGCNPYPEGPPPYCEPSSGFTGPTSFDEDGVNPSLPVSLLYFNAEPVNETVSAHWATAMEENFSKFSIQRSNDGLTFEDIGEVEGAGRNIFNIVTKYSFEDKVPLLGMNYYRLKTIDLDNTFQYSKIKGVRMSGPKKITIYPNPTSGQEIMFRTNFSPSEADRIQITDRLGIQVFNGPATQNSITLENKLTSGVYLLKYISANFEQVERVLVKN